MEDINPLKDKCRPLAVNIFTHTGLTVVAIVIFLSALFLIPGLALSPENIIVLLGIMFAIAGWLFSSAVNIQNRIKQHTFDLIIRTRFDNRYKENSNLIRIIFDGDDAVEKDIAQEIFDSKDEQQIAIRNAVADILNFYEVLAISIWYRDANDNILKDYYKDIIIEYVDKLKNFIPIWRERNPEAFIYTVWLYNEWNE